MSSSFYITLPIFLNVLLCAFTTSASSDSLAVVDPVNFSQNNAYFTFNLLNKTLNSVSNENDKNLILSPFSIQTCLALTFIGSDGKTSEQLSNGLRLGTLDKESVAKLFNQLLVTNNITSTETDSNTNTTNSLLNIVNRIYISNDVDIKKEFNETAFKYFNSNIENVNFDNADETAKYINQWVEQQTNNKIQDLIQPNMLGDTNFLLVNAIYFRGEWEIPFSRFGTSKGKFWLNDENSVDVDMMYVSDYFKYSEFDELNSIVIQLPYKNSELSMLVIVPNNKTGLKELNNNLDLINLNNIENQLKYEDVTLNFPKFKAEFSIELNDVLKQMGMEDIFTDKADFSKLTSQKINVDEVYHKAIIEVDELGTEAAAATYERAVALSLNLNAKYLTVDRPFLYFIKDKNVVYFMGEVRKF